MTTIRWVHRKAQRDENKVVSLEELKEKYLSENKKGSAQKGSKHAYGKTFSIERKEKKMVEKDKKNAYLGKKKKCTEKENYNRDELKKIFKRTLERSDSKKYFYTDKEDNTDNVKINFDINIQFDRNNKTFSKKKNIDIEKEKKEQDYLENRRFYMNDYINENEYNEMDLQDSTFQNVFSDEQRFIPDEFDEDEDEDEEEMETYRKEKMKIKKNQKIIYHYNTDHDDYDDQNVKYSNNSYQKKEKEINMIHKERELYESDEYDDSFYHRNKKRINKCNSYNTNKNKYKEKENDSCINNNKYIEKEQNYNQKCKIKGMSSRNAKEEQYFNTVRHKKNYFSNNSEQSESEYFQKREYTNSSDEKNNKYDRSRYINKKNNYLNLKNRNYLIMATNLLREVLQKKMYTYYVFFKRNIRLKNAYPKYKKFNKLEYHVLGPEKKEKKSCAQFKQKEKKLYSHMDKHKEIHFWGHDNLEASNVTDRENKRNRTIHLRNGEREVCTEIEQHGEEKKEHRYGYTRERLKIDRNNNYEDLGYLKNTVKNKLLHNTLIDNFTDVNLNDQKRKWKYLKFFVILLSLFLKKIIHKQFSNFFFILGSMHHKHMQKREITRYINACSYALLILDTIIKKKKKEILKVCLQKLKSTRKVENNFVFFKDVAISPNINYSNIVNDLDNQDNIKTLTKEKSFANLCFGKPKIFYTDDFAMYFKQKNSEERQEIIRNCLLRSKSDSLMYFLKFSKNDLLTSTGSKNWGVNNPEEDMKNSTLMERFYTATYNKVQYPIHNDLTNNLHKKKHHRFNTLYTNNFANKNIHFSNHEYLNYFPSTKENMSDIYESKKEHDKNVPNVSYNDLLLSRINSSFTNTNDSFALMFKKIQHLTEMSQKMQQTFDIDNEEEKEESKNVNNLLNSTNDAHTTLQQMNDEKCRIFFKTVKQKLKINYVSKHNENDKNKLNISDLKDTPSFLHKTKSYDSS